MINGAHRYRFNNVKVITAGVLTDKHNKATGPIYILHFQINLYGQHFNMSMERGETLYPIYLNIYVYISHRKGPWDTTVKQVSKATNKNYVIEI